MSKGHNVFKDSQFEGKRDAEFFIWCFLEVAEANNLGCAARIIHLREALEDEARDGGCSDWLKGILGALRAYNSMTTKEACIRLAAFHRDLHTTSRVHVTDIQILILVAFEDLPERHRLNMVLYIFFSSFSNTYFQKHLLAVGVEKLEGAVLYLQ